LLYEASSFFKAAFTSGFKEGSEEKMELPEDHPDTVDLFIQYLYGKECELPICEADSLFQYYKACVKLLIFANRYDVQSLKRYILGQLISNTVRKPRLPMPPQKAVRYVYDNTSSKSGIRKFFADWYVWRVERDWFQQQAIQDWLLENPEFAVDLISTFARVTTHPHTPPFGEGSTQDYLDG